MDGFRALAHIEGHECQLVSRSSHVFKSWPHLAEELVQTDDALSSSGSCAPRP
jgi:ATP-dependent DNA ligase